MPRQTLFGDGGIGISANIFKNDPDTEEMPINFIW